MEEICSRCAFDQSETPANEVPAALLTLAAQIGDSVRAIAEEDLRRKPDPAVWSPLEYLGHLRESMAFHRWLLERGLAEDTPEIPMVDPDESVAQADYRAADPDELLAQFDRRVHRLADALTQLDDGTSERTLSLDGRHVSLALVARSAWHECHHHHGDIRRLGNLAP